MGRHSLETLQLSSGFLLRFFRQPRIFEFFGVFIDDRLPFSLLAQLFLDCLELLPQIIVLLVFIHLFACLGLYLFPKAQDLFLMCHMGNQGTQFILHSAHLEDFLCLVEIQVGIGCDQIGQLSGFGDLTQKTAHLFGESGRKIHHFLSQFHQAAVEGIQFQILFLIVGKNGDSGFEIGIGLGPLVYSKPFQSLNHDVEVVFRISLDTINPGQGPHFVDPVRSRLFHAAVPHGRKAYNAIPFQGIIDQLDGSFDTHEERHDGQRVHNGIPQGKYGYFPWIILAVICCLYIIHSHFSPL